MEQELMVQTQQMQEMGPAWANWLAFLLILIGYLFGAYCLARIARKTGMPMRSSFIWALIPIANVFLVLRIGGKPWWWFFLLMIPIVNLIFGILLWMAICERVGKPAWWGILIVLVPVVNLILLLVLVFGKEEQPAVQAA
jgi:phosphatidylglycerophosphate synthase